MARYDTALTTFSPDGNLYQVKYAFEAVQKGKAAVGVRGKDCVVLGVQKPTSAKLQDTLMEKKIALVDKHLITAYSGLSADARVLLDKARVECQVYRLTVEDKPSVEYASKWIAGVQQKYTQSGGVRPFGVSFLLAGINDRKEPVLYKTEPTGNYMEWKAAATGQKWEATTEYLVKNFRENMESEEAVRLCIEALMEVVEMTKEMEIWVLNAGDPERPEVLEKETIEKVRAEVTKKREEERIAREQAASA